MTEQLGTGVHTLKEVCRNMTPKPGRELTGSSGDNGKRTPRALYGFLNARYRFTYDAFSSHENHLAATYSTVDGTFREFREDRSVMVSTETGLDYPWCEATVFWNPPYGRGIFTECVEKAYSERNTCQSVGLIKWDTSTAAARFVRTFCDVWEIGRVRFEGESAAATFASAIVIPRPDNKMIPLR